MTEYEPRIKRFDPDGSVEIPDDAVGIDVDRFRTFVAVQYLVPVNNE